MTCGRRGDVASYLLGSLEASERRDVEEHLRHCPECAAEGDELDGLPGLLARLRPDEVDAPPRAPAALLPRLLQAARRRRRRRRVLVAASLVVVLAGAGATFAGVRSAGHANPPALRSSATSGTVSASVALQPKAWGTSIDLHLSGLPDGERCQLVASARDGSSDVAGTWQVSYAGRADVAGATAIQLADLDRLSVVTTAGRLLVSIPPPSASPFPPAGGPR